MDEPIYLNHAGTSWPEPTCGTNPVADAIRSLPAHWPDRFEKAHASVRRSSGVADTGHSTLGKQVGYGTEEVLDFMETEGDQRRQ
ncbi:MAG: hypothetical protein AAF989_09905 [Planctomycetota bacterium]